MPPSFGDLSYWQKRFEQDRTTFDWLLDTEEVIHTVVDVVNRSKAPKQRILHIGCGTSGLSTALREFVASPQDLCNVDYAQAAIDAAQDTERQRLDAPSLSSTWLRADLLSVTDAMGVLGCDGGIAEPYSLIVDKSTSDSIACSSDVSISLPYAVGHPDSSAQAILNARSATASIHPLNVLAVHLAALSEPGVGRWIAVSYTDTRFPFLPPYPSSPSDGLLGPEILDAGFPDPRRLWTLESETQVAAPSEGCPESETGVHRPAVFHWVYVLARTDLHIVPVAACR